MPIPLTWSEISIRLICTMIAGAVIGLNRTERGHAAGLRTSILVSLAACLAMLQVNFLLPLAGRSANSFVMNDLMRLPLGILSGMGFIGAGAIVKRDNFVVGVTTAATMWLLTVLGLCFGGGQIVLGLVGTVLAILVLAGLKIIEDRMKREHQGELVLATGPSGPDEDAIRLLLSSGGLQIMSAAAEAEHGRESRELRYQVRWRGAPEQTRIPEVVRGFMARPDIVRVVWRPQAR